VFEARFIDVIRVNYLVPRLAGDCSSLEAKLMLTAVNNTTNNVYM